MSGLRKRKGISPVIATVVLVAVTITVVIGVAYWLGGISSQYTSFENVEIKKAVQDTSGFGWEIVITLKNSGTATATLTNAYINDAAATAAEAKPTEGANSLTTNLATAIVGGLTSGQDKDIIIWIGGTYGTLSSGTTVNIKVHSNAGMDYIKLITLP